MKEIIEKVLDRLRQRPYNNRYLAEQIEAEIKQKQDECRFKWIQEQNSITLKMQALKQHETVPKSNITSHG